MQVELQSITKRFGDLIANNDVSTTFLPGQIHGLLGENGAGKSTLMKVLAGWYVPEGGTIRLDGRDVRFRSPQDALDQGIGYVPQDPQDFPGLTVLEHLVIGQRGWRVDRGLLARRLEETNKSLSFDLAPDARIEDLSVGQRLQLAMAQVVINGARVIILDEPPMGSGLRGSLPMLAQQGKAVVFITHNVAEAISLCDSITVLRRGRKVGAVSRPIDQAALVKLMFEEDLPPTGTPPQASTTLLARLDKVSARTDPPLTDVSLQVHANEIVGLAGIEGSGQASLLRVLAGRARVASGQRAIQAKRAHLVPAGRLGEGLVDGFSVEEMLALSHGTEGRRAGGEPHPPTSSPAKGGGASDESSARGGAGSGIDARSGRSSRWVLDKSWMRELADQSIQQFYIKGQALSPSGSLSGGNQQRLMLASTPFDTDLLLLDNPTRGLDVPTAAFIWSWIQDQCERGAGVVVASGELEELWQNATRILVMGRGRIVGEVSPATDSLERLKALIGGAAEGE